MNDVDAHRAHQELSRRMDGYLTTQLLYVVAKLGVADGIADTPLSGPEIAERVGADPALLTRVLRGLAAQDVLTEDSEGRFGLTAIGAGLRDGVPGSPRGAITVRMDLNMLLLLRARERTEAEYRHLLTASGFRLRTVHPTRSTSGVSILEATPYAGRAP